MVDPHVVALYYDLHTDETISFESPPPVEWEAPAFRARLADGVATLTMKEHHGSEESARQAVQRYLRSWEIDAALRAGLAEVRFEFKNADVVDRASPEHGGVLAGVAAATIRASAYLRATAHARRHEYPRPPSSFVASPDVETMWQRYNGYRRGREPLPAMAYFCLTVLAASAGGQSEAAQQYGVHRDVLRTLGRLTSTVGDSLSARKLDQQSQNRPPTAQETAWMEAVVRALIHRVGEWAHDPNAQRPQLTMADLPEL
jgi:hypothetical protein